METGFTSNNPLDVRLSSTIASPSAENTHGGVPSVPRPTFPTNFVAPPPPPPLHGRSNTHSRHGSRNEHHPPVRSATYGHATHSRAPSSSSWIPPPPPPPLVVPSFSGHVSPPPSEGALQLTLTPVDRQNVQGHNHAWGHPAGQSHHSRQSSLNMSPMNANTSPYNTSVNMNTNHSHTHFHYNAHGQFIPFIPNTSPIPISPLQNLTNPIPVLGPSHLHPTHHSHSYTYPIPPGTFVVPSNAMLVARTPSPFERGPFPASSIPSQPLSHYQHLHTLSPHSPLQSPPPPPRPPKPPELEQQLDGNGSNVSRLQPPPHTSSPNIHRQVPTPTEQSRTHLGAAQSPARQTGSSSHSQPIEDIEVVNASEYGRGDKVTGHLSAKANLSIQGGERPFGVPGTSNLSAFSNHQSIRQPGTAEGIKEGPTGAAALAKGKTVESGALGDFSRNVTDARAITDIRLDDGGYDGRVPTNETREEEEDARSDSGMTMEGYDPAAFDFPRRVNDEMRSALSPVTQNFPSTVVPEGQNETLDASQSSSARQTIESDAGPVDFEGEAPPTYDEVEQESQLTAGRSPTSPRQSILRPVAPVPVPVALVAPVARYPTPAATTSSTPPPAVPLPPMSPPPAFRPQTPPRPGAPAARSHLQVQGSSSQGQQSQQTSSRQSSEKRASTSKRPLPIATTGESSSHAEDNLVMTPRDSRAASGQPSIFTSPPTPEPSHSPKNSMSRSSPSMKHRLRLSLPRKFTTGSIDMDSMGSKSPSSESGDPFTDPQTFQADTSPFSLSQNNDSPSSTPSEFRSRSPPSEPVALGEANPNKSPSWKSRARSASGFWSHNSSTPPTPKSELQSHESGKHSGEKSARPSTDVYGDSTRTRRPKSSGSRMSAFFRTPSSISPLSGLPSKSDHTSSPVAVRSGGVDLLADGSDIGAWEDPTGRNDDEPDIPPELLLDDEPNTTGGGQQSVLMDLWEGVEFGFKAPGWNLPPAPGPYSNPTEFPQSLTLYPVGSKPFFIRAPTWRSLLRLLATQSTLRIEPSVEALATSRTPTIDLRLVVQFARNPYTPRGTTRDVCLYMLLHTEMPAPTTRAGKALPYNDRTALGKWDTRCLPYGFVCAEGSLLARHGDQSIPNLHPNAQDLKGTPIVDQDPDGTDSMFVTIPPPFIELPVKMSDIALYLHECLVLSRKSGKVDKSKSGRSDSDSLTSKDVAARLRKVQGSNVNLPSEISPAGGSNAAGSTQGEDTIANMFNQQSSLAAVPGIKRLAKAVKTFYPEEYAIGSSRANQAAEQAAVEEDRYGGKMQSVSNAKKGKSSSGKGGILSVFRSKSASAKNAATTVGGRSGLSGSGRDTNAERFELVTPWRAE